MEVQTSPRLTTKKLVALQVATAPVGSSIRASSAPASSACRSATTSCSLLWLLSLWSRVSGGGRLTVEGERRARRGRAAGPSRGRGRCGAAAAPRRAGGWAVAGGPPAVGAVLGGREPAV